MTINRIDNAFTNFILLLFVAAFIAWRYDSGARHHAAQLKSDATEQRFLSIHLATVQRQGDAVLLRFGTTSSFHRIEDGNRVFYKTKEPELVAGGFTFYKMERHWHGKYTIESIEADGVVIRYEYSGSHPAMDGKFTGKVKIGWKHEIAPQRVDANRRFTY